MNEITTKGLIGLAAGVVGYLYNCLSELLIVLAIIMVFDYIVGATLAIKDGSWNAKDGIWGLIKKLFYSMIIASGFLLDFTLNYIAQKAGINVNTHGALGIAACAYLIGNEGVSFIRNITLIGVPMPPFLQKAFGYVKSTSETMIKIPDVVKNAAEEMAAAKEEVPINGTEGDTGSNTY